MSIRIALENKLATIIPNIPTIYEGDPQTAYAIVAGTPYQTCEMLYSGVQDLAITNDFKRDIGIMQVTLYYPTGKGTKAIEERAFLIRSTFVNGMTLTHGTDTVKISKTPDIKMIGVVSDRLVIVVDITWKSYS